MSYKENYLYWKNHPDLDPELRKELEAMSETQIEDAFFKDVKFETAGMRGLMGVGSNRLNIHTVRKATQGLADYLHKYCGGEGKVPSVAIGYDNRYHSQEFAFDCAKLLAGNGVKAYVFENLCPTPELSYAVRYYHCDGGIMITASHNPKEYNGYKAYWSDGCQVSSEIADGMYRQIEAVDPFEDVLTMPFEEGVKSGMITVLGPEYDRAYLDLIEGLAIHDWNELDLDIPMVYTPLNGAGAVPFAEMMKDRGFRNWHIVEEQRDPDPDFTTVGYPNPESPAAFKLSEELGERTGAELLMATDPDADRFAIELRDDDGNYVPLNGNQTGYLLVNYILEGHRDAGTLPANGAMVKSIVTSTLSTIIAEAYGVKMFESLTGFKNICGRIPELEKMGYHYMFGYEESVGYAACPEIRDKDGISAGMLVAEAAAYYRRQGKTLWQVLQEIYEKYGFFDEEEPNIVLDGIAGALRIKRMMKYVRENPMKEVAGAKVVKVVDYIDGYEDIPASNVMRFWLDNGSWFAIRPSGTEPKIKFYFYSRQSSREKAMIVNSQIREEVLGLIDAVE